MKASGANFSKDLRYRYLLWRKWNVDLPMINFIGLNPSTANATDDDPTMRRCISFAKEWGYGGFYMTNLFAYRTPYPTDLLKAKNPVGKENDKWIKKIYKKVDKVVLAWGTKGNFLGRDNQILNKVQDKAFCLGYTKEGFPRHPLYVKSGTTLKKFEVITNHSI